MDEFIDYEKLDEEYPDLVLHLENPETDYFDYEDLDFLFPDLLINFEDYEYIVPFDYEKLDAEFPELLDFSKYLPTFFVRKDNIKTDHAKFGVDYIDFLNALNSTAFPNSLSKIKSASLNFILLCSNFARKLKRVYLNSDNSVIRRASSAIVILFLNRSSLITSFMSVFESMSIFIPMFIF